MARVGVSTMLWTWPFQNADGDLFDLIRQIGFSDVEIIVTDPAELDAAHLARCVVDSGLRPIVGLEIGPEKDLASESQDIREAGVAYVVDCMEIASRLGAELVVGPLHSAEGRTWVMTRADRAATMDRSVRSLRRLADEAERRGVLLALEPLNRFGNNLVNTTAQALQLVEAVDSPALGMLLDTFHMNIEETDIREAIRAAGDRCLHIHASENNRGVPGTGQVRWADLAAGLADIDYRGSVCIEAFCPQLAACSGFVRADLVRDPDSAAASGLRFLTCLLERPNACLP